MKKNDQESVVRRICAQYEKKKPTELDALRKLDAEVKRPANAFAYTFGTAGSLVLGTGMCLAMKVIGSAMLPGVLIGGVGIAMVSSTYTLYKRMLSGRRARYKSEIEALSEKILEGGEVRSPN